jgi:hypothetical protein
MEIGFGFGQSFSFDEREEVPLDAFGSPSHSSKADAAKGL